MSQSREGVGHQFFDALIRDGVMKFPVLIIFVRGICPGFNSSVGMSNV